MSNITKNHKIGIFTIFIASALVLGTITASGFESAFASNSNSHGHDKSDKFNGHHHDGKKRSGNAADQEIEQSQASSQSSLCISGVVTALCGNNIGFQFGINTGNNALGQQ
jgi:hypothetical protein